MSQFRTSLDQLVKAQEFGKRLYADYCENDSEITVGLFIRTSQMYANVQGQTPGEVDALHSAILDQFGPPKGWTENENQTELFVRNSQAYTGETA